MEPRCIGERMFRPHRAQQLGARMDNAVAAGGACGGGGGGGGVAALPPLDHHNNHQGGNCWDHRALSDSACSPDTHRGHPTFTPGAASASDQNGFALPFFPGAPLDGHGHAHHGHGRHNHQQQQQQHTPSHQYQHAQHVQQQQQQQPQQPQLPTIVVKSESEVPDAATATHQQQQQPHKGQWDGLVEGGGESTSASGAEWTPTPGAEGEGEGEGAGEREGVQGNVGESEVEKVEITRPADLPRDCSLHVRAREDSDFPFELVLEYPLPEGVPHIPIAAPLEPLPPNRTSWEPGYIQIVAETLFVQLRQAVPAAVAPHRVHVKTEPTDDGMGDGGMVDEDLHAGSNNTDEEPALAAAPLSPQLPMPGHGGHGGHGQAHVHGNGNAPARTASGSYDGAFDHHRHHQDREAPPAAAGGGAGGGGSDGAGPPVEPGVYWGRYLRGPPMPVRVVDLRYATVGLGGEYGDCMPEVLPSQDAVRRGRCVYCYISEDYYKPFVFTFESFIEHYAEHQRTFLHEASFPPDVFVEAAPSRMACLQEALRHFWRGGQGACLKCGQAEMVKGLRGEAFCGMCDGEAPNDSIDAAPHPHSHPQPPSMLMRQPPRRRSRPTHNAPHLPSPPNAHTPGSGIAKRIGTSKRGRDVGGEDGAGSGLQILAWRPWSESEMEYYVKREDECYRDVRWCRESWLCHHPGAHDQIAAFRRKMESMAMHTHSQNTFGPTAKTEATFTLYKRVDRVLASRQVGSCFGHHQHHHQHQQHQGQNVQYLVKWRHLPYSECTWHHAASLNHPDDQAAISRHEHFNSRRSVWSFHEFAQEVVGEDRWQETWLAVKAKSEQHAPLSLVRSPEQADNCPLWLEATAQKLFRDGTYFPAMFDPSVGDFHAAIREDGLTHGIVEYDRLHRHQVEGLRSMLHQATQHKGTLVQFDQPGMGRKAMVVVTMEHLLEHRRRSDGRAAHGLVVAPHTSLDGWCREFQKWTPHLNAVTFAGTSADLSAIARYELQWTHPFLGPSKRARTSHARAGLEGLQKAVKADVVVCSPESLDSDEFAMHLGGGRVDFAVCVVDGHGAWKEGERLDVLCRPLQQVVPTASSTNILIAHPQHDPLNTITTATPEEVFATLAFIDPHTYTYQSNHSSSGSTGWSGPGGQPLLDPHTHEGFMQQYGEFHQYPDLASRVQEALLSYAFKRELSRVSRHLPAQRVHEMVVPMTVAQKRAYAAVYQMYGHESTQPNWQNHLATKLRECCNHPLQMGIESISSAMRQGDIHPSLRRRAGESEESQEGRVLLETSGKLAFLGRLLPALKLQKRKVILLSQFAETLSLLEGGVLSPKGFYWERLDVLMAPEERQMAINRFNETDETFLLLSTFEAGAHGVDITPATTIIHMDPPDSIIGRPCVGVRCECVAQTREVTVYQLVAKGSYEAKMLRIAANAAREGHEMLLAGDIRQMVNEGILVALTDDQTIEREDRAFGRASVQTILQGRFGQQQTDGSNEDDSCWELGNSRDPAFLPRATLALEQFNPSLSISRCVPSFSREERRSHVPGLLPPPPPHSHTPHYPYTAPPPPAPHAPLTHTPPPGRNCPQGGRNRRSRRQQHLVTVKTEVGLTEPSEAPAAAPAGPPAATPAAGPSVGPSAQQQQYQYGEVWEEVDGVLMPRLGLVPADPEPLVVDDDEPQHHQEHHENMQPPPQQQQQYQQQHQHEMQQQVPCEEMNVMSVKQEGAG
ncbi:unnamed protein product [Vitrella brassicaformis CCMP3155]|uniref:Chromo domain-containing protein n=5 Tax=Vitrella brassicaformis TaxID=1169539 RepID=A0A0G4GIX1_VITBC|nr:unnamed protein product [Vitrella brassicaformis CCMP3155]|eukprot:CEM29775.1 unnamed protein product [Vitrella brassicaformis CCMP3155]